MAVSSFLPAFTLSHRLFGLAQVDDTLLLDGPTGTELIHRGFVEHPLLWTASAAETAPDLLAQVHRDYLRAGAELLTTNTFRTTSFAARQAGIPESTARAWLQKTVDLSRRVCHEFSGPRFVLGSLAPLADCYRPQDTPEDAVLQREHARTANWLSEAGCDGILVETQSCGREARIAVEAAVLAGQLPVLISFLPDETGRRLLGGDDLLSCAEACLAQGARAVLVNCAHSEVLAQALAVLQPLSARGVLLGAYPNAAHLVANAEGGAPNFLADPAFANQTKTARGQVLAHAGAQFRQCGARIIGACCGFGPSDLAALVESLRPVKTVLSPQ